MLCDLDNSGSRVFYVAPYFHKAQELNRHYLYRSVAEFSIWFRPSSIGPLPNNEDHYVAFAENENAYLFSESPKIIKQALRNEQVIQGELKRLNKQKRKIDDEFFSEIIDRLLRISGNASKKIADLRSERLKKLQGKKDQNAIFAAFLSRSILNAELFVVSASPVKEN